MAKRRGIKIIQPKFGFSKSDYFFDKDKNVIAKGLSSVKYMSASVADELYELSQNNTYEHFSDLLYDIIEFTSTDSRQLDILIKIDYFSDFGNQRELFAILDVFEFFKRGRAKMVKKESVENSQYREIIERYSRGTTKSGAESKNYTLLDPEAIIRECDMYIKSLNVPDLSLIIKARNFNDIMGYSGYVTGNEEDRNKLYIKKVFPVKRKRDGQLFAYNLITQSLGSGKESHMTVFKRKYDEEPVKENDIIRCKRWERDGNYFRMLDYEHLVF